MKITMNQFNITKINTIFTHQKNINSIQVVIDYKLEGEKFFFLALFGWKYVCSDKHTLKTILFFDVTAGSFLTADG